MPAPGFPLRWIVASLSVLACDGGGAVSDPGSQIQFALTATSTDPSFAAVRSDEAAINVERAWIAVSVLELEPCSDDAAPIGIAGEYPLDLAHDPPSQAVLESFVTEYCELGLGLGPAAESAPERIAELAVHVEGVRSDGERFSIESELEQSFELAGSPSTRAFEGLHFAIGFDLARWFDGVDLDAASVSDDVAVIRAGSNEALLAAFESNTAASIGLYVDADRDGVLDADELEPIAEAE